MRVSINQPAYLPWLGYFERIARSDLHIVLDHVQFEKNSFTNRNKIRTAQGWTWLTVPLRTGGRFGDLPIERVEIAEDGRWRRKHWDSIRFSYAKAPFFAQHAPALEALYAREWAGLAGLLEASTGWMLEKLGISTPLKVSSRMGVGGTKSELVLNLCREVGATTYISGALGRNYLDEAAFHAAGIAVEYQDYAHPSYTQVHGGFEPYMAALDLLLNHGPASRAILLGEAP